MSCANDTGWLRRLGYRVTSARKVRESFPVSPYCDPECPFQLKAWRLTVDATKGGQSYSHVTEYVVVRTGRAVITFRFFYQPFESDLLVADVLGRTPMSWRSS